MRGAYKVLAGLIMLGVLVQAAAVAGAWFDVINAVDDGTVINEDYEGNVGHAVHGIVGMMVMPLLGLIFFVLSFFAKIPGGVKWAGFTFLAILVQVTLAFVAFGVPLVGVLHGFNAFIVFGLAVFARQNAARAVTAEAPGVAPTTAPV